MALKFVILSTLLASVASLEVQSFEASKIEEGKSTVLTCKGDSEWKSCDISKGQWCSYRGGQRGQLTPQIWEND